MRLTNLRGLRREPARPSHPPHLRVARGRGDGFRHLRQPDPLQVARPSSVLARAAHFQAVISTPALGRVSRTNFLANLLLFSPGRLRARRGPLVRPRPAGHRGPSPPPVVAGCRAVASLTAEFLQEFAPGRVPALADVDAQTVGCLAGVIAWLAAGPAMTRGCAARSTGARGQVEQGAGGLRRRVDDRNLAPFDITLDLGELSQRFHSGMITMVPFGGLPRPPCASRVGRAHGGRERRAARRARARGLDRETDGCGRAGRLRLGAAFVAGMEGAQIFIVSHAADITDVMFGWLGVAIGVLAGGRVLAARRRSTPPRSQDAVELDPADGLVPGAVRLPLDAVRFQPRPRDDPRQRSPACRSCRSPAMRPAPTSTP